MKSCNFFAASLLLIFTVLFLLALSSTGVYDPGDGVMHHLYARYAGKHPLLFLDHWGKPFYILLSFPFAQFGYNGSVCFGLLCLCGCAWFVWKTAGFLKIPYAPIAALLAIFAPIALPVGMSGLTEPLFALLLTAGIYFALTNKNKLAAILISFLPFVRTEGFFLAPIFGIYFLSRKQILETALLASGTLLYSIAGYFFKGDFLWVIHENPYTGEPMYGHGAFTDFLTRNEFIWGWGLDVFGLLGFFVYAFPKKTKVAVQPAERWLVPVCWLVFFFLHTVFWWKGWFGSLGLERVMACTIPPLTIIAMRGVQWLRNFLPARAVAGIVMLFLGVQVFLTLRQHPLPMKPHPQVAISNEAARWLRESNFAGRKIFCDHPYPALAMGKDPFDPSQWSHIAQSGMHHGDIILWESMFAGGQQPQLLEKLRSDTAFLELRVFGEIPQPGSSDPNRFAIVLFEVK